MEFSRLFVVQKDARMVVEFDDDDGGLDAVVEWVVVAVAANPAEICFRGEAEGVLEFEGAGGGGQVEEVFVDYGGDEGLLGGGHGGHGDAFVGDDAVVAVGAAEVALVVAVPAARRHGRVVHEFVGLRFCLQLWGQGLHELEAELFFACQDAGAFVGARVDLVGLGAGEPGRDDDLAFVQENVEAEVVAIEGPAPGLCG